MKIEGYIRAKDEPLRREGREEKYFFPDRDERSEKAFNSPEGDRGERDLRSASTGSQL